PRVQELTKIEERNGKKQDEVALLLWPRRHALSPPVSPPVLGKFEAALTVLVHIVHAPALGTERIGETPLTPRFPLDHSETARPTAAEWGGDESVETAQIAPPRCVDLEFQDAQQQRRLDWQSDEADSLLADAPRPRPATDFWRSGITVNQSQGLRHVRLQRSLRPSPSGCSGRSSAAERQESSPSSPKPQRRRTSSGDTAVGHRRGQQRLDRLEQPQAQLELDRQQQSGFNSSMVGGGRLCRHRQVRRGHLGVASAVGDSPKVVSTAAVRRGGVSTSICVMPALTPRTPAAAAAGGSRSSSPKKAAQEGGQQSSSTVQMSRNRAGSLVLPAHPRSASVVNKAAAENLTNQNAAAADFEQPGLAGAEETRPTGLRRASSRLRRAAAEASAAVGSRRLRRQAVDSDDGVRGGSGRRASAPSGMARGANSRRLESRLAAVGGTARCGPRSLLRRLRTTRRLRPYEQRHRQGVARRGTAVGWVRWLLKPPRQPQSFKQLEFLMQDAQVSHGAPDPSSQRLEKSSTPRQRLRLRQPPDARRSPSKILGAGRDRQVISHHSAGSIESSVVGSNSGGGDELRPTDCVQLMAGDRNGHGEAWGSRKDLANNALIEVPHKTYVEACDKMVAKQRQFLTR
uniref:Protein kinase domain-containing protein n=1 Tax=Macrostomum lignano TaxID=282301 RepID=A0A1I8FMI5_9PLAT